MHPDPPSDVHVRVGVMPAHCVHAEVCTFDTFDGSFVLLSGLNLGKEEPQGETRRHPEEKTGLIKDCSEPLRHKRCKTAEKLVPNKLPPFNSSEVPRGLPPCFNPVSERQEEEKHLKNSLLASCLSELKPCFSLFPALCES